MLALVSIYALTYPSQAKADIKDDIIVELHELCGDDFILEEIVIAIIEAESNFNPTAKNPHSTAKGLFQFLKGTFKENCGGNVLNWHDNLVCGARMLQNGEFNHWKASKSSWYPNLSLGAKLRVKAKSKVVAFVGGLVAINTKGDILDLSGKIWKGGTIPFLD